MEDTNQPGTTDEETVGETGERKPRSESELKKLAMDIVDGLVYTTFMVPMIKKRTPGETVPSVVYLTHSESVITPLEMMDQSLKALHSGVELEPDVATINTMFPMLAMGAISHMKEIGAIHLYEYADKRDHATQINKLPLFWSCHYILDSEMMRLTQLMAEYDAHKRAFSGPIEKKTELPATVRVVSSHKVEGGTKYNMVIYPVRAWASDKCTLLTGYREGVEQNKEISLGASCARLSFVMSDEEEEAMSPAKSEENPPVKQTKPKKKSRLRKDNE